VTPVESTTDACGIGPLPGTLEHRVAALQPARREFEQLRAMLIGLELGIEPNLDDLPSPVVAERLGSGRS
jgi:hypothetical protein